MLHMLKTAWQLFCLGTARQGTMGSHRHRAFLLPLWKRLSAPLLLVYWHSIQSFSCHIHGRIQIHELFLKFYIHLGLKKYFSLIFCIYNFRHTCTCAKVIRDYRIVSPRGFYYNYFKIFDIGIGYRKKRKRWIMQWKDTKA